MARKTEKEFEMVAGYHENIVALSGELKDSFSPSQYYGTFTAEQVVDRAMESEATILFTPAAYEKLKPMGLLWFDDYDLEDGSEQFLYERHLEASMGNSVGTGTANISIGAVSVNGKDPKKAGNGRFSSNLRRGSRVTAAEETTPDDPLAGSSPIAKNMWDEDNGDDDYYDDRRLALSEFLGIPVKDILPNGDGGYGYGENFNTPDGEEYDVMTDREADDAIYDDIESLFDEAGWVFNLNIEDYVEGDWFEDAMRESYESYVEDIENEDDGEYGNRLIRELDEAGLLGEFYDEDNNLDIEKAKDADLYNEKEELVDKICGEWTNAKEWYEMNFGLKDIPDLVKRGYMSIDMQSLVDDIVSMDGRGGLAGYDGVENEQDYEGTTYYIYRTN